MSESSEDEVLCEKINAAMQRNELSDVRCRIDEKGPRLVGFVNSDEERAIAFAIARTTVGVTSLSNGIEVRKSQD